MEGSCAMKGNGKRTNKIKHLVINGLILIILVSIVVNQTFWLANMYILLQSEFHSISNLAVKEAVLNEIAERTEEIGGWSVFSTNMSDSNDTSRYFTKRVISEDSTFIFTIDKQDPNATSKIIQLLLKDKLPINLDKLNTIFKEKIEQLYEIENTYFDYFDLKNDTIISSNKPIGNLNASYIQTDTIPLDILNSVGVIGYIKVTRNTILNKMARQLILSISLILIAIVSLIYVSRSFILQWKTEKMRQESINAMTHEFKRPISGAVAMVSVIPYYLNKNEIDKVLAYTQNIEIELNKLTHYTKRIQEISNNEKEDVSLEKTPVEIIPFFESLHQRYNSPGMNEQEVVLDLHINTLKKELYVDLLHFSNVMDNLIENAIKYTVNQPVNIKITVSDTADGLKISVQDNGIGISSTDRKRIFDKFYRVKRGETKNKAGFGLGLTYVKSIIEAHGGSITVNSKLNEGSEFIITLKE